MSEPQPNDGFAWTQAPWGPALRCVPLETVARHLFTTGNLRLDRDSDEWSAVANVLGVDPKGIRLVRQVHGTAVAVARRPVGDDWAMPEADIVLSDDQQVAVGVRVADCAPVLIADLRRPVVAAVHAGWRGTLQGVAARAVRALGEEFGSDPGELIVAIGPCLGPCCGEVGPDVVEAFREAGYDSGAIERWFVPGPRGRPHLDLWQANRAQLEQAGVRADRIHVAELCTKTHASHLHSYRAAGSAAGRMAGVIRAS